MTFESIMETTSFKILCTHVVRHGNRPATREECAEMTHRWLVDRAQRHGISLPDVTEEK